MKTIGAGDLIDRSTQFYRLHSRKILVIVFWNVLSGIVASSVETVANWTAPDGSFASTAVTIAVTALALAVNVVTYVMLVRLVVNEVKGVTMAAPGWKAARKAFWPTAAAIFGSAMLIFLGLVAFVVPGIVFWIWFAFAPIVAALGEERWTRSFSASREVSAGRFLTTSWRLAAPLVFFSLLQLVAVLIVILAFQGTVRGIWTIELMVSGAPLWFLLAVNATTEIVRDLLGPLYAIAITLLYLALKEENAGASVTTKRI